MKSGGGVHLSEDESLHEALSSRMSDVMELTVNGELTRAAPNITIARLLAQLELADRPVAVEVNRDLVPKREHDTHVLQPGDEVECVTLVGGG